MLAALLEPYDALRAADLAFRDRLSQVHQRLVAVGGSATLEARLADVQDQYERASSEILSPLAQPMEALRRAAVARRPTTVDPKLEQELQLALAAAVLRIEAHLTSPPLRVLGTGLPYHRVQLAPRTPVEAPTIQPCYLGSPGPQPVPADLTGTSDAPLAPEILQQASALGFDYVRIFEFVRNGIVTEWYGGGMKGAVETLKQGSGNDVDQASLLIALLRAASVPARYEHGVVELPVEAVAASLGLGDPQTVPQALAWAGVAVRPVIAGGRVAAVVVEHTWVAAYLPYSNYRGAVVDFSGKSWLPLMPAVKAYSDVSATGILRRMGLSVDGTIASYLAAPQPAEPLTQLRQKVASYLNSREPGSSYSSQLGSRTVQPQNLGILPSSLPAKVDEVTLEEAALGANDVHQVRFVVRSGTGESDPILLDASLPLSAVANRRVTLSYLPATVDDHRAVDAFGGLDSVPVYLVRLRPQIKVDGHVAAVGEPVAMGAVQGFEITVSGPYGSEQVAETLLAGSYEAIAFGAQRSRRAIANATPDPADTEQDAARLLAQEASGYSARWDAAEDELAGLLAVAVVRPLPSIVAVSDDVEVTTVFQLPVELTFTGVSIDAPLRVAEPLQQTTDTAAPLDWMRLSGLEGSALEHQVLEDDFLVESMSADKGLGLARQRGIMIESVDSQNAATLVPALNQPSAVQDDITNWARLGMTIEVPQSMVSLNGWTGSVWQVDDPTSGGDGYFIAGGLAGGSTTIAPDDWVLQFLKDALAAPYSSEPNRDPLAGVTISRVVATDQQQGEVGSKLPVPLAALVRDGTGRPVEGASVTFLATEGGGSLFDSQGNPQGDSLTVETDRRGIATVVVQMGTHTEDNPVYVQKALADRYSTQALAQLVDATAPSSNGFLVLDAPFSALAYPGRASRLRRTDTTQTVFTGQTAGTWADTISIVAEDSYGNPVSNTSVTFAVGAMVTDPSCANTDPNPANASVFDPSDERGGCPPNPVQGQCGAPYLTKTTSSVGASVGVILGNSISSAYTVNVTSGALTPLRFEYDLSYGQSPNGDCTGGGSWNAFCSHLRGSEGQNIQATLAGQLWAHAIECSIYGSFPNFTVTGSPGNYTTRSLTTIQWVPASSATVQYTVDSGGRATPAVRTALGSYTTTVTTGPTPALNQATLHATNLLFTVELPNPQTGILESHTVPGADGSSPAAGIWGLNARIVGFDPSPIPLTAVSRAAEPVTVRYAIDPPAYVAQTADVELSNGDGFAGTAIGTSRSETGTAEIQSGFPFDITQTYSLDLVLNRGGAAEVRSPLFPLPLFQSIFTNVEDRIVLRQEIDLPNQLYCMRGDALSFTLEQRAAVTLTVKPIVAVSPGGSFELGAPQILIDHQEIAAGDHAYSVSAVGGGDLDLGPGTYALELRGVADSDHHTEIATGVVTSEVLDRDSLPVGHMLVKGVDLFDGSLILSRQDFRVAGRGVPLDLHRAYSSKGSKEPGDLGVGWTHSYESFITINPCGTVTISGGDGSGTRFVADGAGGFRPLKGHHGTLIASPSDHSFTFYSKNGTRYHYSLQTGGVWLLDSIMDRNGNATTLTYDPRLGRLPKLAAVTDPAGRALSFHYQQRVFTFSQAEVLTEVDGPGGFVETFTYDGFGNLATVAREPNPDGTPSRSESYQYALAPSYGLADRDLLTTVTDNVTGAVTSYVYGHGTIGLQGDITVSSAFVSQLTEPEGGVTRFSLDPALADAAAIQLGAVVTDPRGKQTTYVLNRYGSATSVADPTGYVTAMTWATDDVLMTSRTDGNGVVTDFTYDTFGNELSESLAITDFDGTNHSYTTSATYAAPTGFEPPHVKDLLATRTDRNGNTTTFIYDSHGNLLSQSLPVTDLDGVTSSVAVIHTYLPNGDRATSTDARAILTSFAYDTYGNLARTTDALGGVWTTTWDSRSRPKQRIDALGRVTLYGYDTLDRLVTKTLPRVDSEASAPVESTAYDDPHLTVTTTDAVGHQTISTYDHQNRIVQVENPAGGTKTLSYDAAGNKVTESTFGDAATPAEVTTFDYDDAGRLIRRTAPLGKVTDYAYDAVGNVTREALSDSASSTFAPRVTTYGYDGLNRRISTTREFEGGVAASFVKYDGEGRKVLERDALSRDTSSRYDELGRLLERLEPEWRGGQRKTSRYVYDGNGNTLEERHLNEPVDRVRRMTYDPLNRLTRRVDGAGASTLFEYDAAGNKTREIDGRLDATSFVYDARNRLVSKSASLNRVTTPARQVVTRYGYDAVGNRTREEQPNGNVVLHEYDGLNRLTATTDSMGPGVTYGYDARGNRVRETDGRGSETRRTYDALDRVVRLELPETRAMTSSFDVAGNKISETDARGYVTTYAYDQLNRQVLRTDPPPGWTTISMTYDLVGNKLSETDRRGNTTAFAYDGLNRLVLTTDPSSLGTAIGYSYDAVGNRISEKDRRGFVTQHAYDGEGRKTSTKRAGVELQRTQYDAAGNVVAETDANGHATAYQYDERNLRIEEDRPLAAITRFTLDDMGDRIAARDPEGRVTQDSWDLRRRQVSETNAAGEATHYEYDGNGNRTALTRPSGKRWSYAYDRANRLVSVTDPLAATTSYTYDPNGNRTAITDANDHATSLEYDERNRLTARVEPGAAREQWAYDGNGNRIQHQDAMGRLTTFAYDALNRQVAATYPAGEAGRDAVQTMVAVYDGNGNPTQVTEQYSGPTGPQVETKTYDAFDRLESVTDPRGKTLRHLYDAAGNRTALTDPDGLVTRYAYDELNRLVGVTTAAGVAQYTYLRDSRLQSVAYPNGVQSTQTYDAAGRIATVDNEPPGGVFGGPNPVSRFTYTYDPNGNRTQQVETRGTESETTSYGYDDADRLASVSYPDKTVSYTYDGVGNRLTERVVTSAGGTPVSAKIFTYDDRNELLSSVDVQDATGSATYTFDPNGNQTGRTQGGIATEYHYDVRDRLIEVRQNGTVLESYGYASQGLRTRKVGAAGIVRYVYDQKSVLVQTDDGGNTVAKYDYGPDRLLSLNHVSEGRHFYLFDALRSVTDLTSGDGMGFASYQWDVWGNPRGGAGNSFNAFGFTGHERDSGTGLYYARARFYDPGVGRFLTEDPAEGKADEPPSLHRYSYVRGNPLRWWDPSGTSEADVHCGMTYFIGVGTGMDRDSSRRVAEADESVDQLEWTSPVEQARRGNWQVVYDFHFPLDPFSRVVKEGTSMSANVAAWSGVLGARNPEELGYGLHPLQDSFPHAGAREGNLPSKLRLAKSGWMVTSAIKNPELGITHDIHRRDLDRYGDLNMEARDIPGLHSVDWTFTDTDRAIREARATFEAFVYYLRPPELRHLPISAEDEKKWGAMLPALRVFVTADTVAKKRAWFREHAPEIEDSIPWSDLTLDNRKKDERQ